MCAEVKLYLMILERLGSWEKALEVLQAPLGEPACSSLCCSTSSCGVHASSLLLFPGKRIHSSEEWDSLLVDTLVQCKQWSAAATKLQQMLEKE